MDPKFDVFSLKFWPDFRKIYAKNGYMSENIGITLKASFFQILLLMSERNIEKFQSLTIPAKNGIFGLFFDG